MDTTEKRKEEHIKLAMSENALYASGNGFDFIEPLHNSLPELDFYKIDTRIRCFNKLFSIPLVITGMTGGFSKAKEINIKLALAAEKYGILFGLGSQRAMLENKKLKDTYAVKKYAKGVFLIGNIGGYQLKTYNIKRIEEMANDIELDALAVHLNPLQELIQKEGDKNWEHVEQKIAELAEALRIPIIIKETGAGINDNIIKRLKKYNIHWFDISGKGGTSWSKIEYMRSSFVKGFEEWGNQTALCLALCAGKANIIASGGIRNGIDGAKALMLGANLFGAARPFLIEAMNGNLDGLINEWHVQLKSFMFLTGSKNISALKKARYIVKSCWLSRYLKDRL
ncbi:MAG: type 2 isopentenyl-diphosphate Delta-isomerase [Candidatus Anstonellales archaeon]